MAKISKRNVDALMCQSSSPTFLWDDVLVGFGVKALPSGKKRYLVKYRAHGGGRAAAQRWLSLGTHGHLTCDQARSLAQQVLAAVARGEDPQSEKFQRRSAPRLRDVWNRFETDYLPHKKPQTKREYKAQWIYIISPRLGDSMVTEISRNDVSKLHISLGETPYRANRVLALCSRLMTLAEAWEWRDQGTNPCRYIPKFKEQARSRYLGASELQGLGTAIRDLTDSGELEVRAGNAIKLLLLTGARLNEVLTARWGWVNWERHLIELPDSKTGRKAIYLSDAAVLVLRHQLSVYEGKNAEPDFIFPGRSSGKHMVNLRKPWLRVCECAGIVGVRLHDLRHTAASIAVGQGATLPVIGRLLGHSQAQTTLRYAHVDTDPALIAANLIGVVVSKSLG